MQAAIVGGDTPPKDLSVNPTTVHDVVGVTGYRQLAEAVAGAGVCALDVEWKPDELPPVLPRNRKRAAALLQLAFPEVSSVESAGWHLDRPDSLRVSAR